jgi:pimeloyl-ACP methyl ester carboxylesterase
MPNATNVGIRIHYEVVGSGPPLVLHHGSFASGADWRDLGYADVLKHENQLILIDARGHGASDKPHNPAAYDLALRVSCFVSLQSTGLKWRSGCYSNLNE